MNIFFFLILSGKIISQLVVMCNNSIVFQYLPMTRIIQKNKKESKKEQTKRKKLLWLRIITIIIACIIFLIIIFHHLFGIVTREENHYKRTTIMVINGSLKGKPNNSFQVVEVHNPLFPIIIYISPFFQHQYWLFVSRLT